MEHNKLVRDKIPAIIEDSGETAIIRVLSDAELKDEIDKKLVEELNELLEANDLEEAADLLEVLIVKVKGLGYSLDDLLAAREKKRMERGGFDEKIFLIRTE